jgi:hypothetical protein
MFPDAFHIGRANACQVQLLGRGKAPPVPEAQDPSGEPSIVLNATGGAGIVWVRESDERD